MLELDRHFYRAWPRQRGRAGDRPRHLRQRRALRREAAACSTTASPSTWRAATRRRRRPRLLADVDIIVSTGCVGYVTATTFQRAAKASRRGRVPWVASFVLRMFPYRRDRQRTLDRAGSGDRALRGRHFRAAPLRQPRGDGSRHPRGGGARARLLWPRDRRPLSRRSVHLAPARGDRAPSDPEAGERGQRRQQAVAGGRQCARQLRAGCALGAPAPGRHLSEVKAASS